MDVIKRFHAAGGAVVIAVSAAGVLGAVTVPADAASAALPLSLGADASDGSSAHYNSAGNLVLTTPAYGSLQGFADMAVNLTSLGDSAAPQAPPSFTTDNYSSGSPYWYIPLANNTVLRGYPSQIGGTANDSFTGDQWTVSKYGGTPSAYETYQQALAAAGATAGSTHVSAAVIREDGGTAANTATLTNVQYDGETAAPGTNLTVASIGAQAITVNVPAPDLQVPATEVGEPDNLTYSLNGMLPAGLTLDSSTGVISGTPTALGTSSATITVTDAFGDTASTPVSYTVKQITPPTGTICSTSTGCSWERLQNPSSMVMDVQGGYPTYDGYATPLIAYGAKAGDPAADFTKVPSGFGSSYLLTYTPYGTRQTAEAANPTLATETYNADGSAKECVSAMSPASDQPLRLQPCTKTANALEDFVAGGRTGSYSMFEPTFGTPGVSAGSSPLAINDQGYGGNGSYLINYAATGSGNELFTPGL